MRSELFQVQYIRNNVSDHQPLRRGVSYVQYAHNSVTGVQYMRSNIIWVRSTANFLMVVSPAVLAYDVSARAGDVSMGIAVFPNGWIYSRPFEKLRDG